MADRVFTEKFKKEMEEPNLMKAYIWFNNERGNYSFKFFCAVEGSTDVKFYRNCLHNRVKTKPREIRYIHNVSEESKGGKEKVVSLYRIIKEKNPNDLGRCLFIVDRDYDALESKALNMTADEKEHITMLPCYSFENYYLYIYNLQAVFKHFFKNKSHQYITEFLIEFENFIDIIKEFSAIKKTLVEMDSRETLGLGDAERQIERGNYSVFSANVKAAEKRLQKRGGVIYNQYLANIAIVRDSPNLIKGKILLNFLMQYISNKLGSSITPSYFYPIAARFKIEVDIKYCSC